MQLSGHAVTDRKISAVSRPHGVVGRDQLLAAGIGGQLIDRRVESGWLRTRPRHPGIRVHRVQTLRPDEVTRLRRIPVTTSAQLPVPEVNVSIHGYELDFLWREQALAVEIDGFVSWRPPKLRSRPSP